jgi:hypothetical protein
MADGTIDKIDSVMRGLALNRSAAIVIAVVSFLLPGETAENKPYVHKTMVDTLIQQAFVTINAAADNMPGSDVRRQQSLVDARRVATRLRAMARGDANEKYVLWKTGELESQILLEERDLFLRKMEKVQKEKNAIIDIFNAELGKKRPDFIILQKAGDDMMAWDPSKAREIQWSMDQRSVNISREVIYTLEKALLTGDLDKTQREFDYCNKNRSLLQITSDKFNRFEARIKSLGDAVKLKPSIDEQVSLSENVLPRNNLREARKCLQEIQSLLSRIDRDLPPRERDEYAAKAKKLSATISRKEDSLVAITYSILSSKGENAAIDHVEGVLKPYGVSEPKIGQVHTSIMNVAALRSKAGDTTLNREMKALSSSDEAGIDFSNVRSRAKKKAQDRADSARQSEEERARILRLEQDRADSARQVVELKTQLALREKQENANTVSVRIYTLLEENKSEEAFMTFSSNQKSLEQFLYKDAFALLQSTVTQAHETIAHEKAGRKDNTPPLVEKTPTSVPAEAKNFPSDDDLRRNQDKARQVIMQIYGMLEANQIEAAYKRFTQVRRPLEKYLSPEVFTMLETTVKQSFDSFRKGR